MDKFCVWIGVHGCALATAISWSVNYHIGWAIFHGIAAWIYVIYYGMGYGHQ